MNKADYFKARLSDEDLSRISSYVESFCGIKLSGLKKAMVQNRLYKRLIKMEMPTFEEYVKFVFTPAGAGELTHMVDEITTNKTDFFREKKHFEYLVTKILPKERHLKCWSAGCSTGEEPYTLAMILSENNTGFDIFGTDLSYTAIEVAKQGIYHNHLVDGVVEADLIKKYFTKEDDFYKISSNFKHKVIFEQMNLLDSSYKTTKLFDVIFFRNVLIYFDIGTQARVLRNILPHLKEGGHLFIGHSETIYDKNLPLKSVSHAVYKKQSL